LLLKYLCGGKDFEGGRFQTEESDGRMADHEFEQGDALAFCSHKAHCVGEVTKGTRNVLVVEFWKGPPRTCPHRCEKLSGTCPSEERETNLKENNNLLPFRLGAVEAAETSNHQPVNRLLWEPTT